MPMYKILGADQKEYGPASADVIVRWIAERRLDARSKVRRDGEPIWRTLGEFPEFAAVLDPRSASAGKSGSVPTPAAPRSPAPSAPGSTLAGRRRTSGLAVATLVIGLLAPCTAGLAGLVGAILGFVSLRQIARSQGRLTGRGLAIAGLVLSILWLFVLPPLVVTAIFHARQQQMQWATGGFNPVQECMEHERQLAEAIRRHANDNDDRFPPAATWCDAIQGGTSGLNAFQCPARPDQRCGYAFNSALSGKPRFEVARDVVLLFESDGGWNASGGLASAVTTPRHAGLHTIILVDGSVRQVPPSELSALRWDP